MSEQPTIGIIAGTGLYELDGLEEIERLNLSTRWGEPSSEVVIMQKDAQRYAFLARHGLKHNIPPHKVNYRANLWALKECGVEKVIAVAAVGGITGDMSPETLVVPDQIIDYTYGREHSFFADDLEQVTHIDFTEPYSAELRKALIDSALGQFTDIRSGGVYAATQGPRLETAAEIERLKRDGANIVGMTGMPEAALARELEIEYACLALVVNWAAGCAGTRTINLAEVQAIVDKGMVKLKSVLMSSLSRL